MSSNESRDFDVPEAPAGEVSAASPGGRNEASISPNEVVVSIRDLSFWYGETQALCEVSLDVPARKITALIGPSGCGKSTLLRCVNRLTDLVDEARLEGTIDFDGSSIYAPSVDVNVLRKRIGMVFQKPNPFPKSIRENVAFGPRIHGISAKQDLDEVVEKSLRAAALWEEVKDRLGKSALGLSGGQQQRLCIARAIAVEPEVLLFDEPCSALDPVATGKIEDLMEELKERYSLIVVTHNMQQASRASDYTAFFNAGRLVEYRETDELFTRPALRQTEDYISGRFG